MKFSLRMKNPKGFLSVYSGYRRILAFELQAALFNIRTYVICYIQHRSDLL